MLIIMLSTEHTPSLHFYLFHEVSFSELEMVSKGHYETSLFKTFCELSQ